MEGLFTNGGTASYSQFANAAKTGETFTDQTLFDAFVDADVYLQGSDTNIPGGIVEGARLLTEAPPAVANILIFITDGNSGSAFPGTLVRALEKMFEIDQNLTRCCSYITYVPGFVPLHSIHYNICSCIPRKRTVHTE